MSREQGPHLMDGEATGRECRLTPTVFMSGPIRWIGGGGV